MRNTNSRTYIGLVLVVIGILFLLNNYGIIGIDLSEYIFRWETIFIIIGAILLINSHNKTLGTIFVGLGIIGLIPNFWPVIFIIIGLYILYRRSDSRPIDAESAENGNSYTKSPDDELNEVAVFGGGKKVFSSKNFSGGKITSIFGGSEIDLRDCYLSNGTNVIDIFSMFGGSTLIVPKDWNVRIDIIPILGGYSDKRYQDPNMVYDTEKRLLIKGLVIIGGGEIKN